MSDGVSVIICCHNSARRLPETLRHLAAQRVSSGIRWEIVVIDNASTDNTGPTALSNWPASSPAPLRVVAESEPGLSHARIRGIREARYEVISFIDDDNWASTDWIERVSALFTSRPEIGACGGTIRAVCETTPPAWFESVQGQYAVGQKYAESGDITDTSGTLLCGAGLNLRTQAVCHLFDNGFVFLMSGRKGGRLTAGEDTELCFALRAAGWRFWYDHDLVLRHFIPAERLKWTYAIDLMRGMGRATPFITLYLIALDGPPFDVYPSWKKNWAFQISKALLHLIRFILSHPSAYFRPSEGTVVVLEMELLESRVAAWWALRGQYTDGKNAIRQSTWRKPRPPAVE